MSKSMKASKGEQVLCSDGDSHEDLEFAPSSSRAGSIPLLAADHSSITQDQDSLPTYEEHNLTPAVGDAAIVIDQDVNAPPGFSEYYPKIVESEASGSVTSYDAHLNNDGEALYRFLVQQNKRSPRPTVGMRGTHSEKKRGSDGKSKNKTVTDFDLRIDMTDLLLLNGSDAQPGLMRLAEPGEFVYRGGRMMRHGPPFEVGAKDWRGWIDEYCRHEGSAKEFRMVKTCPGYDRTLLEHKLRTLIQSTNYRGTIQISWEVLNSKVTVRPDNRLTHMRYNKWVRGFFFITFLWIFAWPVLWYITHRYEVARSVWPMATTDENGRRVVKMTEEQWYSTWSGTIAFAVMGKRIGWLAQEDLAAFAAGNEIRSGNALIDGVASVFLQSQRMRGWGEERVVDSNF